MPFPPVVGRGSWVTRRQAGTSACGAWFYDARGPAPWHRGRMLGMPGIRVHGPIGPPRRARRPDGEPLQSGGTVQRVLSISPHATGRVASNRLLSELASASEGRSVPCRTMCRLPRFFATSLGTTTLRW